MFYKHWKKIALALTGFFWNSCDNGPTAVDNGGATPSSSSNGNNESSSSSVAPIPSSSPLYGVMSSVVQSSSSNIESSSSFEQIMPAYGVYGQVACYEDGKGVKTNGEVNVTKLICDDGVICKEHEVLKGGDPLPCSPVNDDDLNVAVICPDYGIVYVSEKTYDCDGVKYNEAEFRTRYDRKYTTKPVSSSSAEQSSSSAKVTCAPNLDTDKFISLSRVDRYSTDKAISDASSQAKFDASRKITAIRDSLSENAPQCLKDIHNDLESNFIALYGAPYYDRVPKEEICSDGTTRPTKEYLEQKAFDEEQEKKRPQYEEKYNEVYKEEKEKLDKKIEDCLNSEKTED